MNIQELEFDELKTELSNCTTSMLLFIIMMANNELIDRNNKNKL